MRMRAIKPAPSPMEAPLSQDAALFRLLLIDDNPDTRAIVALALELHPRFNVHAVSRLAAADVLRRGDEAIDLILLDMKLSDMSPNALLATLRRWAPASALPVLILSPKTDEADRRTYRAAGAHGVIAKPFDPIALPERILELIEVQD